ncbi:flagellar biosynthesis protein FlhA [bacterium]|nr:flagellar biosynthesis protein FlhA [bacterium]
MADLTPNRTFANSDLMLAVAIILVLMVMIFPVPPVLMDLLLAVNLAIAMLILMVSLYIRHPLQFSVFPGLLLIVTLFRLSLNVATTRLILGEAYAGKIILAFGDFVIKGNYVVGLIIFLILVIINFVVITKGAGRVAEVAARFTLDSMPGKQMAIDADLNAGVIDEKQARLRREAITQEADFYGSMDGASKFVRGDAIAGLVITVLNIVGGFIIGMAQHGMTMNEAVTTYTRLTVGDGLVSQIPSLIISTAAGMVVTRTATDTDMGSDVIGQIFSSSRAIYMTTAVLFALGITPGLPFLPFFVLGTVTGAVGYIVREPKEAEEAAAAAEAEGVPEKAVEEVEDYLRVDPLELEIGYGLIPMVDTEQGGDLLSRITQLRKQCATEIGIIIPPIRIRDNIQLKPHGYMVIIKGVTVATGELALNRYMALNPGAASGELEGMEVIEPAFGLPATWIAAKDREKAEMLGYTVVEAVAVLTTHILEILKAQAHLILTRQDVRNLLDNMKKEQPVLVEELVPNILSLGIVEKVLQNLLKERVSIRNLGTILESLSDWGLMSKDSAVLTEYARQALSETLIKPYVDDSQILRAITLSPAVEQIFQTAVEEIRRSGIQAGMDQMVLPPEVMQSLYTELATEIDRLVQGGFQPVIVTPPAFRSFFRKMIEGVFNNLVVLSYGEIPARVEIESVGTLGFGNDS